MIHYLRVIAARLGGLFGDRRADREFDDEIETHLRLLAERYVRQGMTEAEAAWAARRQFGNVTLLQEENREMRGIRFIETFVQDLRYGLRMLRKNPGFTIVAALTLSLGIGANTAIFSVVNAVLLRPLPYPEGERLMQLRMRIPPDGGPVSAMKFLFWRENNRTFESMAAYDAIGAGVNLSGGDEPERIRSVRVSADFFRVYGIFPALGRGFTPEEDSPGGSRVVVISDGLWKRRFGADPMMLGKSLNLSGESYTVIGIMAPGFEVNPPVDIWTPLRPVADEQVRASPLLVIGRMKPGVTQEQAQVDMDGVARAFRDHYPALMNSDEGIRLYDYRYLMVRDVRTALLVLMGAAGFVLLIASANVASLSLARAAARQKEVAIRSALGAGRFRLIRQLLIESALLAVIGGALGLLVARWGLGALITLSPTNLPRLSEIQLDGGVLLFTLAVALSTGVLFGLAPAFQLAKVNLNSVLNESGRTTAGIQRSKLRSSIVVIEIGLSLMLLVGAALLIQTFANLRGVDPGFDPRNVLTLKMSAPEAKYNNTAQASDFFDRTLQRIEALPGVQAAAVVTTLPFENSVVLSFSIPGMQDVHFVRWRMVSPNYFRALSVPLRRGRYFTEGDSRSSPAVALINESLARQYFPDKDPIGELLSVGRGEGPDFAEQPRQIVGVVADMRESNLMTPAAPGVYVPDSQVPDGMTRFLSRLLPVNFVIRTSANPLNFAAAVKQEVLAVDPEQPVFNLRSMEQMMDSSISRQRFQTLLLGAFAAIALLLAAIGVYGVMSYSVSQRTREIGIRMALGARAPDVIKLVVSQGLILALAGAALGVVGALALTQLMAGLLFGVSATDPATFALGALLLVGVALIASYIPARRATKVDPLPALRHE